ncbi:folylpolyglutamate synthase/dihydrofolate synthase family protein [uncultured Treponema sp.]|uniref:bifunctional folylpolyglutamate synthase/dihydrofolate synthase n=1 Tax=uncultured Treponema sp. TaxID=162155 RepID=UPI0025CCDFE4|nr:folylpolyglutamate synthase/dihydrofolate synthase family protein [uncultured Treponema sp.]
MAKMKSIEKLEAWIDSYLNFEKTPKKNIFWLDTMNYFCEKFGHPENFAPCFHVAGSKGKGSVSTFIASILDEAGFKTGLYTSPHILDFIERVSSPKGEFDEEVYDKAVKEIMDGVQNTKTSELPAERPITWFELVTLFSFLVFRQAKVDYSVFEVGLGGRLDSTNVVKPICSVITPIELEHTEFLGDSFEKIAFEKGGIIKENTPVIISKQRPEVREVLEKIAEEKHSQAFFAEDLVTDFKFYVKNISSCIQNHNEIANGNTQKANNCIKNHTTYDDKMIFPLTSVEFSAKIFSRPLKFNLRMLGSVQAENAALAAIAVKTAIPYISEEQIEKGLSKASIPARFEVIPNPEGFEKIPFLILDGAHTVNSVKFTMETMNSIFGTASIKQDSHLTSPASKQNRWKLLFACAADKDAKDIAPLFKNSFTEIFLTKPGNVKASDLNMLTKAFDTAGLQYDCDEDFEKQIMKALKKAHDEESILLVTGSFYLIAEVKKIMLKMQKI